MPNFPTAETSALFVQKSYGDRPQFRGFHAFTGGMTKNDGSFTPIFEYLGREVVGVSMQRGVPEMVSVTMDAPLTAIADLISKKRDCPVDLILVADNCLSSEQKQGWNRWGTNEPQVIILIPEAYIETRGMENLASREASQPPMTGNLQLKFMDWQILRNNARVLLYELVNDTTVTGITATDCGESGCMTWYAATASGGLYQSSDSGLSWSSISSLGTTWSNGGAVYADERVVMLGGDNGMNGSFGVQVSYDRGETWAHRTIATATGGTTGTVAEITRYADDYIACTGAGIYRTYNRGTSWQKVCATADFIACKIDSTGFGVAVRPTQLWFTKDGGMHWTALTGNPGSDLKDVAINGGYVHVVDSTSGYFRSLVSDVRYGAPSWTLMDATEDVTKIVFQSRLIGYRLRDIYVDRTINGGYTWEQIMQGDVSETALMVSSVDLLAIDDSLVALASSVSTSFTTLTTCGDHVLMAGNSYVAHYNPFYETENS